MEEAEAAGLSLRGKGLLPCMELGSVGPIIPVSPKNEGASSFNVTAARGAACVIAVSEEQANVSPSWGGWAKF